MLADSEALLMLILMRLCWRFQSAVLADRCACAADSEALVLADSEALVDADSEAGINC